MITVQSEHLIHVLPELKQHFPDHWAELALNQDKVPLDPDYDYYLRREAAGEVLCVTAREAGQVRAYFVGFVAPGLHYRSCLTLTMDIFWVHPDYRDGDSLEAVEGEMVGMRVLELVRIQAKKRCVQRVFMGTKSHKSMERMFEELGLIEVERYYSAWWGE